MFRNLSSKALSLMPYPFTVTIQEVRASNDDDSSLRVYRPGDTFSAARLKAIAQHFDELQYTIFVVSYSEWMAKWRVKKWVDRNNPFNHHVIEVGDVLELSSHRRKTKFRIIVSAMRNGDSR